jgi:hypothetical protein
VRKGMKEKNEGKKVKNGMEERKREKKEEQKVVVQREITELIRRP